MDKLLEKLGVYEIFTYIFSGIVFYFCTLALLFLMTYVNSLQIKEWINYLNNWYALPLLYFGGLILHEMGEIYERIIFRKGMPSERLIQDKKYEKMKVLVLEKLKEKTNSVFMFEDKNQSKVAFGIIYSTVQDTTANEMIQKMNQQYGLFRTLSLGFIFQILMFCIFFIHRFTQNNCTFIYLVFFISIIILALITTRRMIRFGYRFSDYCYRAYVK